MKSSELSHSSASSGRVVRYTRRTLSFVIAAAIITSAATTIRAAGASAPFPGIVVYVFTFSNNSTKHNVSEDQLVQEINGDGGLYVACDKSTKVAGCSVDDAQIIVYGNVSTDGSLQLNARNNSQNAAGQYVGSLTIGPKDTAADVGGDKLQALLGEVKAQNGKLVTVPGGYQQFVQLVPQSVSPTDPDYSGLLAFLLSKRGVAAFASQFTLGAVGSNPTASDCAQGPEYLIYRLNVNTVPHPLIGYTRIGVSVAGTFVNCNVPGATEAFSGEARTNVPTTSASMLTYTTVLKAVFPALGWTTIALGLGTLSGFVDQKTDSLEIRGAAGEFALRNLVDNFCTRHPTKSPFPTAEAQNAALHAIDLSTSLAEPEKRFGKRFVSHPNVLYGQKELADFKVAVTSSDLAADVKQSLLAQTTDAATASAAAASAGMLDPGAVAIGPKPYDPACRDPEFAGPNPDP